LSERCRPHRRSHLVLTCRAVKRFVLADAVWRLVGTEAITASSRCCRTRTVFTDIAVSFPDLPLVAWFAGAQFPARQLAKFHAGSVAVPHGCGGRQRWGTGDVAPVSPAQVQKTSASLVLRPICLHAHTAQSLAAPSSVPRSGCTLNTRLSFRSWGLSSPARAFDSFPCCNSPIDRLSHREGLPRRTAGCPGRITSRPSQSDSRVHAHNERVVGNGCHTASSTRTSLGVPALQGFTPSILHLRAWLGSGRSSSQLFRVCTHLFRLDCYRNLCHAPDFAGAPFACLTRRWLSPLARLRLVSNRHPKVSIDGRRS